MSTERIDEADLKRHKRMLQYAAEAQAMHARAQQLLGAYRLWCEELHESYGLALDGSESVQDDGSITRKESP